LGQEFVIKSTALEDKINQLLPSQGGAQPGVDLSASTMVVPIVDLTESAEGSSLRLDLQKAFSHTSNTEFGVNNSASTIITTTGYFRIIATFRLAGAATGKISLSDGTTTKDIVSFSGTTGGVGYETLDFIVFLKAGDSCIVESTAGTCTVRGSSRQIADINGNLVNPL
tara:strand:- start:297 stop:803 length:507 start_codon:yes stop_codon:yes gene_type:complete